jgi:hypothetical protein
MISDSAKMVTNIQKRKKNDLRKVQTSLVGKANQLSSEEHQLVHEDCCIQGVNKDWKLASTGAAAVDERRGIPENHQGDQKDLECLGTEARWRPTTGEP